jgi:lipoprotein-releasing system permease protein
MQWRFIALMSWRYLYKAAHERSLHTMIIIAFSGIFIGSCALALTVAIMTGFQKATLATLQGIHAHLIINLEDTQEPYETVAEKIQKISGVAAYSPNYYAHGLLEYGDDALGAVVMLHGINPKQEQRTTALAKFLIRNDKSLTDVVTSNQIIVGSRLAEKLHITVGDVILLRYAPPQKINQRSLKLDSVELSVAGIIKTGIEDLDAATIICADTLIKDLWPEATPVSISVRLQSKAAEQKICDQLKKSLEVPVHAWYQLYPSLVAALKLEKLVSFFVLSLISLVASMNIFALIFMIITNKRVDIAVLRAMGAQPSDIVSIFFGAGILLASSASLLGICTAYLLGLLLTTHWRISLPDAYIVNYLPVDLTIYLFVGVLIFVMLVSTLATWLASRCVHTLPISETLRFGQ